MVSVSFRTNATVSAEAARRTRESGVTWARQRVEKLNKLTSNKMRIINDLCERKETENW
jgi:hypothetical protein